MHLAVNVNVLVIVDGTLLMVLPVLLIACLSKSNRVLQEVLYLYYGVGNGCLRTGWLNSRAKFVSGMIKSPPPLPPYRCWIDRSIVPSLHLLIAP